MAQSVGGSRTAVGRQFYSWSTVGSFGGSVMAVTLLLQVGGSLIPDVAGNNWAAFALAAFVVGIFALLTEPAKSERVTTMAEKGQKVMQTLLNIGLVYAAVIGLPVFTAAADATS